MSEHWRTRGHGAGGWLWPRLSFCTPLRTAVFWLLHRYWLAYWYSPDGETWEKVA